MGIDLRVELDQLVKKLDALARVLTERADAAHDLRVATRRLDAHLALGSLRGRRVRVVKKQVRKLRKAAGRLRDHAVFRAGLATLLEACPPPDAEVTSWLYTRLDRRERRAEQAAQSAARSRRLSRIRRGVAALPDEKLRGITFQTELDRLDRKVRQFDRRVVEPTSHHEARLTLKALRYSLEPFVQELGLDLAPLRVRQDELGALQDLQALTDRLAREALRAQAADNPAITEGVAVLLLVAGNRLADAAAALDRSSLRPYFEQLVETARQASLPDSRGEDDVNLPGEQSEEPPAGPSARSDEGAEPAPASSEALPLAPLLPDDLAVTVEERGERCTPTGADLEAPGELPAPDEDLLLEPAAPGDSDGPPGDDTDPETETHA